MGPGSTMVRDSVGPGGRGPEPDEPIPGWRKPISLVGWALLIVILLGLIVWGILQLARGAPPQEPATTFAPTMTSKTPTRPRSSAAPVAPNADIPTASTENTGAPTTSSTPAPRAFPIPQLPSVITLPSLPGLPGLPTAITLPPGL